jgi:Tripartite tricarboxylate transporter TctB family
MNSVQLWRSVLLLAIAALFGWQTLQLNIGSFTRPGAGLFPALVSGLLALIAITMLIKSRFEAAEPVNLSLRSITFVILGIIGFAILAHWSVIPAVIFLVFVSSLAGTDFSVMRCVQLSIALIAIAAAFRYGLGLNLRFY